MNAQQLALLQIMDMHGDAGASQGYTDSGYGVIEHCCNLCGTFGEYGEEWPCATYEVAEKALTAPPVEPSTNQERNMQ